eukprot:7391478-Prymnesium_polylepis.1
MSVGSCSWSTCNASGLSSVPTDIRADRIDQTCVARGASPIGKSEAFDSLCAPPPRTLYNAAPLREDANDIRPMAHESMAHAPLRGTRPSSTSSPSSRSSTGYGSIVTCFDPLVRGPPGAGIGWRYSWWRMYFGPFHVTTTQCFIVREPLTCRIMPSRRVRRGTLSAVHHDISSGMARIPPGVWDQAVLLRNPSSYAHLREGSHGAGASSAEWAAEPDGVATTERCPHSMSFPFIPSSRYSPLPCCRIMACHAVTLLPKTWSRDDHQNVRLGS